MKAYQMYVSVLVILTVMIVIMSSVTVLAEPRLPSETTYQNVLVATVPDGENQFDLKTNIYLPENLTGKPTPLLLFIHGNGGAYNFANGSRSYELTISLTNRGIAVATIDYRPKTGLPENVYDVKAYVRYFRAHAAEYNIDPNRVGIWGTSRGGHLASMLATTGDSKELEGDIGGNLDQSSNVQAAVIYYPFTDIFLSSDNNKIKESMSLFFGISKADAVGTLAAYKRHDTSSPYWKYVERINQMNPLTYVSKDCPPVLIACGAKDTTTPIIYSSALYDKFVEKGAVASFYSYSQGVHGIVGSDIEIASAEWMLKKLLVELAHDK